MKHQIGFVSMLLVATQALAGGSLETAKLTDRVSQPGFQDVDLIPISWDQRCVNVNYTLDDVPANAGTANEIPSALLRPELQASFERWNAIRTSFINMNLTSVRQLNNGAPRLDFINEITFEVALQPPGVLAVSRPISLTADTTFAVGDDLDGDGDADVFDSRAAGRNSCFDIDSDGDIEFPAGLYKAGTIVDNDVSFSSLVNWSTLPTADRSVDIQAVATHEFGHSHGLRHSTINQLSSTNGEGATMYPFIDTDDLASEQQQRNLHADDIAWSSFVYPEGTALTGPAALQRGDRPFALEYGLIKGQITTAGVGVLGASVKATTADTRETKVEGYSGTARLFFDPVRSTLQLGPGFTSVVNGNYSIPVPLGLYDVSIEALDGSPVLPGNISVTPQLGQALGQNRFPEESRLFGRFEDDSERFPAASLPVLALPGFSRTGIDLVTNNELRLRNGGLRTSIGLGGLAAVRDVTYAERFTNAEVLAQINAGALLTSALFETDVFDASVVPRFKRAGIFTGRINPDGVAAIDFANPIVAREDFVGQQSDSTPLYATKPTRQTAALQQRLAADPTLDVFLVLENNNEFTTGSSGQPPLLSLEVPRVPAALRSRSYISVNGLPLRLVPFNWSIELRFLPPAASGNSVIP